MRNLKIRSIWLSGLNLFLIDWALFEQKQIGFLYKVSSYWQEPTILTNLCGDLILSYFFWSRTHFGRGVESKFILVRLKKLGKEKVDPFEGGSETWSPRKCLKFEVSVCLFSGHLSQGSYASWKTWKCPGILFLPEKIMEFFKNKDLS